MVFEKLFGRKAKPAEAPTPAEEMKGEKKVELKAVKAEKQEQKPASIEYAELANQKEALASDYIEKAKEATGEARISMPAEQVATIATQQAECAKTIIEKRESVAKLTEQYQILKKQAEDVFNTFVEAVKNDPELAKIQGEQSSRLNAELVATKQTLNREKGILQDSLQQLDTLEAQLQPAIDSYDRQVKIVELEGGMANQEEKATRQVDYIEAVKTNLESPLEQRKAELQNLKDAYPWLKSAADKAAMDKEIARLEEEISQLEAGSDRGVLTFDQRMAAFDAPITIAQFEREADDAKLDQMDIERQKVRLELEEASTRLLAAQDELEKFNRGLFGKISGFFSQSKEEKLAKSKIKELDKLVTDLMKRADEIGALSGYVGASKRIARQNKMAADSAKAARTKIRGGI